jgi:hypothetical protein
VRGDGGRSTPGKQIIVGLTGAAGPDRPRQADNDRRTSGMVGGWLGHRHPCAKTVVNLRGRYVVQCVDAPHDIMMFQPASTGPNRYRPDGIVIRREVDRGGDLLP